MARSRWIVLGALAAAVLAANAAGAEFKPGKGWLQLFNGKDLTGWKLRGKHPSAWAASNGVLGNPRSSDDIISEKTFKNFQLHIEFKVNRGGNSGVYLRGRKEVQIYDSFGTTNARLKHWDCGGVYGKFAPSVNACKAPGEWQAFDITIVGRKVTVVLNGKTVLDGKIVNGPTGGQLDNNEDQPGPLMLQGDHAPVWFRNIWTKPLP